MNETSDAPRGWKSLLERQKWIAFVLPLAVFMIGTSLEPTPETPGGQGIGLAIGYDWYPLVYVLKIAATLAAMAAVAGVYRQWRFHVSPLALIVGAVGFLLWIVFCRIDLEHRFLQPWLEQVGLGWIISSGTRSGFNPLAHYGDARHLALGFLAVRIFGLGIVVPVIEEFFLRGFLMRFVVAQEWWKAPIGQVNRAAVVLGTLVPVLMHPGELLAAAVWFSLITWLLVRTRNIWDCVGAHASTNLLLAVHVLMNPDEWFLL